VYKVCGDKQAVMNGSVIHTDSPSGYLNSIFGFQAESLLWITPVDLWKSISEII
jgi:hypothetical protein